MAETTRDRLGLPAKPFLYTIDQLGGLLELSEHHIKTYLLHYEGISPGVCPRDKLRAVNIMPKGETPEWRVAEDNLIGWLKYKGVRFFTRSFR